MQNPPNVASAYTVSETVQSTLDGHASGVSWGAVLAGAAAGAALSFILLILGAGLGLSSVSPWSYNVASIGKSTILWLAFTQLAAAGTGGYLAGRLRVKWPSVHSDEVYFRDTAHGLLAWSVSTLLAAALMAGAARALLGGTVDIAAGAGSAGAAALAQTASKGATDDLAGAPLAYFTDMVLRSNQGAPETDSGAARAEVAKIFTHDMARLAPDDKQYLGQLVAKRTGMTQADAERRVDGVYARLSQARAEAQTAAKEAADKARKAATHAALWLFVALLLGAFFASLCATFGGRQRDGVVLAHREVK